LTAFTVAATVNYFATFKTTITATVAIPAAATILFKLLFSEFLTFAIVINVTC